MPTRTSAAGLFNSPYNARSLAIGMRNISSQPCPLTRCCLNFSAGGVRLISGSERITIDNTLDERLRLLEEQVRYFYIVR